MKAIFSAGPDAALTLVDLPIMAAGAGEALVDVHAAGVGRVDLIMRQLMPPGFVPGIELAGIVTAVGPDIDPAWVGQRVFARVTTGAYAQQAVVSGATLVALPEGLSFDVAVASGVNSLVAYFCLVRAKVVPGERVVVRGARGGIGHLVVQMATRFGAEVIESRKDENPVPADVVIDLVAGPDASAFIEQLNANGRYIAAGVSAGIPAPDFAASLMVDFRRSRSVSTLSLDTIADPELNLAMAAVFADVLSQKITPAIARILPLDQAEQAHQLLAAGGLCGKIVLVA